MEDVHFHSHECGGALLQDQYQDRRNEETLGINRSNRLLPEYEYGRNQMPIAEGDEEPSIESNQSSRLQHQPQVAHPLRPPTQPRQMQSCEGTKLKGLRYCVERYMSPPGTWVQLKHDCTNIGTSTFKGSNVVIRCFRCHGMHYDTDWRNCMRRCAMCDSIDGHIGHGCPNMIATAAFYSHLGKYFPKRIPSYLQVLPSPENLMILIQNGYVLPGSRVDDIRWTQIARQAYSRWRRPQVPATDFKDMVRMEEDSDMNSPKLAPVDTPDNTGLSRDSNLRNPMRSQSRRQRRAMPEWE